MLRLRSSFNDVPVTTVTNMEMLYCIGNLKKKSTEILRWFRLKGPQVVVTYVRALIINALTIVIYTKFGHKHNSWQSVRFDHVYSLIMSTQDICGCHVANEPIYLFLFIMIILLDNNSCCKTYMLWSIDNHPNQPINQAPICVLWSNIIISPTKVSWTFNARRSPVVIDTDYRVMKGAMV